MVLPSMFPHALPSLKNLAVSRTLQPSPLAIFSVKMILGKCLFQDLNKLVLLRFLAYQVLFRFLGLLSDSSNSKLFPVRVYRVIEKGNMHKKIHHEIQARWNNRLAVLQASTAMHKESRHWNSLKLWYSAGYSKEEFEFIECWASVI